MGQTSSCRNCGLPKTPDYYSEPYCEACTLVVAASDKEANQAGADAGQLRRLALAQRAHFIHNNRPDPRRPISKHDYLAIPGEDPSSEGANGKS